MIVYEIKTKFSDFQCQIFQYIIYYKNPNLILGELPKCIMPYIVMVWDNKYFFFTFSKKIEVMGNN